MRIGILGGTGPAGSALGLRLASIGCDVLLGSRDSQRAVGICTELARKWPDFKLNLNGGDNDAAADCEQDAEDAGDGTCRGLGARPADALRGDAQAAARAASGLAASPA